MGIFAQIQSAVDSILPQLYEDEDLTTIVTWKKFSSSEFDHDAGVNVETYTDYTNVTAIKVEKEIGSKDMWRGNTQGILSIASGDVVYLFRDASVPEGASIRDLIIDGAFTYSVKKIFPVFGLIVKVEVEGYA
jgi:hypothetical protein